jgi:predicted TIM-barrel fold metal-dependent hydrolase
MLRAIYAWFENVGWQIPNPEDAARILDDVAASGADRALVLVYSHKAGIARPLNAWLADLARRDARVIPVGCVHPDDPDLAETVAEALDTFGFLGIKLHCNVGRFHANDPRLDPLWEALRERGRLAIVHAGTAPLRDEWVGLKAISSVLVRFPGLKVQLPHLGMREWETALDLVERHEVWLDTANVLDSPLVLGDQAQPFLARLREAALRFPDRILYGSDYPILEPPLGLGIERLRDLRLGGELTDRLLGGNAAQLVASAVR